MFACKCVCVCSKSVDVLMTGAGISLTRSSGSIGFDTLPAALSGLRFNGAKGSWNRPASEWIPLKVPLLDPLFQCFGVEEG